MNKKFIATVVVCSLCFSSMIVYDNFMGNKAEAKPLSYEVIADEVVAGSPATESVIITKRDVLEVVEESLNINKQKGSTKKKEIKKKVEKKEINQEELDLLAHLIYAEAGSDWCSDTEQLYVGSVVLNRMKSNSYPDTMEEVIYQPGQYQCVDNGMIYYEYNDRAYKNAKTLLEEGSKLPDNVVYAAEFSQGSYIYTTVGTMIFSAE